MNYSQYTNIDPQASLARLKSTMKGLSTPEAAKRLIQFGLNEIKSKRAHWLEILGRQFKSPFFYLLFGAGILSFAVKEIVDGFVILSFIFANVALGFLQEYRSERAITLLRKFIAEKVRVIRDGKEQAVEKRFLVRGDIVRLEAGNIIPADLRLIKSHNLVIDESILTGESVPVAKHEDKQAEGAVGTEGAVGAEVVEEIFKASNILFSGTSVLSGEGLALVIQTGLDTAVGSIAKLTSSVSRPSAYEASLFSASKLMMKIVAAAILFIFIANLVIKGINNVTDFLIFCVALVVSILPEALPVVVTFALTEGSLKMAREKVVARRLTSIEDLGNIEVLCTDKTGTLTQNKLILNNVVSLEPDQCLLFALLTSPYVKQEIGNTLNSFDLSLWHKASTAIKQQVKKYRIVNEISFDSVRMRSTVLAADHDGHHYLIVKGAAENILPLCSHFPKNTTKEKISADIKNKGLLGQRILAVAFKTLDKEQITEADETGLTFAGYLTFGDPLKETAHEAISLAKKLGVRVKIITGDAAEVAAVVAKQVGLVQSISHVVRGIELEKMTEVNFDRACEEYAVFARVSPQTKYRIIQSLQKKYEVGFMGEGTNDAPALKMANVGIAVDGASDVSREVADLILTQKDLRVLVHGIKNGRMIFSNINKYIKCSLASNFGNFYSIAVISLFIPFLPMLPVQILLGNLLSDFPLVTIATDAIDPEELKRPKVYHLKSMIPLIITLALVSTTFDFIFFAIFHHLQPSMMQTLWFIESILTEIALIFSIRTSHFFLKAKRPSWPLLSLAAASVLFAMILPFTNFGQQAFHFAVVPSALVSLVILLVLAYFVTSEIAKLVYFRFFSPWKTTDPIKGLKNGVRHFTGQIK